MSSILPFDKNNWLNKFDYTNGIDYFFTQRKVLETTEYLDEKTLERKEKKEYITYNFLALNFPTTNYDKININIEIWGDKGFNYEGEINTIKGDIPNILLKLNEDTEIFVKLIYNLPNDKRTYVHFIPVLKRYQK